MERKRSIGFRRIFTVALKGYFRLCYVNVNNCTAGLEICSTGLEPPTEARNRKAIVKIRRNRLLRFLSMIRLPRTYKKLHIKPEPYWFSGQQDPLVQADNLLLLYKDKITLTLILIFKPFSVYLRLNLFLVKFILKCFQDKDKPEDLERGEVIYVLEVRKDLGQNSLN